MAGRITATYYTELYEADDGRIVTARGRSNLPTDITQVAFGAITTAAGFTPLKYDGVEINIDPGSVCPEGLNFKPRELIFIRRNGNSLGIKIADRTKLITAATTIKTTLDGLDTTNPVVCIQLKGETWKNIIEELGGLGQPVATTKPPRTSGKQAVFTQRIQYHSDPGGAIIITPVKINSDLRDTIPTPFQVNDVWAGCVGDVSDSAVCPGRSHREHRRYIATVLATVTTANGTATTSYQAEIPVGNQAAAKILDCGQKIADLPHVYCLGYQGENNSRFHKLL